MNPHWDAIIEGNLRRYKLSPAERRVALGVIAGQSNNEIAVALCISEHTVKNHLTKIYERIEIPGNAHIIKRTQLVVALLGSRPSNGACHERTWTPSGTAQLRVGPMGRDLVRADSLGRH